MSRESRIVVQVKKELKFNSLFALCTQLNLSTFSFAKVATLFLDLTATRMAPSKDEMLLIISLTPTLIQAGVGVHEPIRKPTIVRYSLWSELDSKTEI